MAKYRWRPVEVVVEAIQFTGWNLQPVAEFLDFEIDSMEGALDGEFVLDVCGKDVVVHTTDYIVRYPQGGLTVMSAADFEPTHEQVDE